MWRMIYLIAVAIVLLMGAGGSIEEKKDDPWIVIVHLVLLGLLTPIWIWAIQWLNSLN